MLANGRLSLSEIAEAGGQRVSVGGGLAFVASGRLSRPLSRSATATSPRWEHGWRSTEWLGE